MLHYTIYGNVDISMDIVFLRHASVDIQIDMYVQYSMAPCPLKGFSRRRFLGKSHKSKTFIFPKKFFIFIVNKHVQDLGFCITFCV